VLSLGFGLILVNSMGPALTGLTASGGTRNPAQMMAAFHQLGPFYLYAVVFGLIFYPIVFGMMNRAVLRADEVGLAYIRLGADEVRQLGLILLLAVIGTVAYLLVIIAIAIVAVGVSAMFGMRPGAQPEIGASLGLGLVVAVAVLAIVGAWVYVWVRLSLASPLTFATRRINVFGSWAMTRGLFWPIFGAYAVAVILALIVSLLTLVISLAISGLAGGGLSALMHPDTSSMGAWLTPARVVNLVIQSISTALVLPILLTPAPAVYRHLTGAADTGVASTFE
jgi:hypothetical protein